VLADIYNGLTTKGIFFSHSPNGDKVLSLKFL
jgi:hypothetical protein